MMKKTLVIIGCILLCFLVGFIASRIQSGSISEWYPTLNKPSLIPPNSVFPIAWSILYVFMGLSIGLIINKKVPQETYFVKLFGIQLLLNFLWSISFFYMRNPLLGLINIILLLSIIIYYAVKSYPVSKISSILFIPYICWVAFATYLNLYILLNN